MALAGNVRPEVLFPVSVAGTCGLSCSLWLPAVAARLFGTVTVPEDPVCEVDSVLSRVIETTLSVPARDLVRTRTTVPAGPSASF